MTKHEIHELMAVGGIAGAVILVALLWHGHGQAAQSAPSFGSQPFPTGLPPVGPAAEVSPIGTPELTGTAAQPLQSVGIPSVSTPNFSGHDCGCQCGGSCPSNPNQIPSIAQMQAIGKANADAIYAQGDATLRTLANMGSNPWLNVTVEPSSSTAEQAQ